MLEMGLNKQRTKEDAVGLAGCRYFGRHDSLMSWLQDSPGYVILTLVVLGPTISAADT
jgi:hypothetical protein